MAHSSLVPLCLLLLSMSTCISKKPVNDSTRTDMQDQKEETLFTLGNPEQMTFNGLKIAVGNIWEDDETDPTEGTTTYTAGLWLYPVGEGAEEYHTRITAGQIVEKEGYRIRVVEIPDGETVVLGVTRVKE